MEHMEKPANMKHCCYQAQLDSCIERISVTMHLEKRYGKMLLFLELGGQFLIAANGCPSRAGHNVIENRQEKKPGYPFIVDGSGRCTVRVSPGSKIFVFYSDEEEAALCKMTKMKEVKLHRQCVPYQHRDVQNVGGGQNGAHGLR